MDVRLIRTRSVSCNCCKCRGGRCANAGCSWPRPALQSVLCGPLTSTKCPHLPMGSTTVPTPRQHPLTSSKCPHLPMGSTDFHFFINDSTSTKFSKLLLLLLKKLTCIKSHLLPKVFSSSASAFQLLFPLPMLPMPYLF